MPIDSIASMINHKLARITQATRNNWLLLLVVGLSVVLRVWAINFGLPYTVAPDEPSHMDVSLAMLKNGDLNPHWIVYPHLAFNINAFVFLFYFAAGRLLGVFQTLADIPYPEIVTMGVGKLALPSEFLLMRGVTAFFGIASVVLVYLIGKRLRDGQLGLIAALFFAVSPAAVSHSHLIRPDTLTTFCVLLAFLWIDRAYLKPTLRNYILAGIGIGLAFAAKYNAGLIVLPLLLAHWLNFGWRGFLRKEIYIAGVACLLTFAVTNPYYVIDFSSFQSGLAMAAKSQSGHAGEEGDTVRWYLSYLWSIEGLFTALGFIQAIRFMLGRNRRWWVLVAFPAFYYIFINLFIVRNDRTVLLVLPFFALLAGQLLLDLRDWLAQRVRAPSGLAPASLALATCLIALPPLRIDIASNMRLLERDGRDSAKEWIQANLPAGTRIAVEAYTPYLDTTRYVVQGIDAIVDRDADWYMNNGFEYLVFSQNMYSRFVDNPQTYPELAAKYNGFFARFQQVAQFDDNDFRVRVFKTNVALPAHRIAARYGNDGEIVELIGYDNAPWMAGNPLRVTLVWRTLLETPQPLEVLLTLRGRDERTLAQVRGDLFQGKGWRAGTFATEWTIPPPADTPPGAFRLEVGVVQSRFGYRLPAMTWTAGKVDPVLLSPLKMSVAQPTAADLASASPAAVTFGNQVELISSKSSPGVLARGSQLSLMLYWQSLVQQQNDYTVFVHLLDSSGQIKAQVDAQPRDGTYPTSLWDAGEVVPDDYTLQIPSNVEPGDYTIELGIYRSDTLERLKVTDAQRQEMADHWVLPTVVTIR